MQAWYHYSSVSLQSLNSESMYFGNNLPSVHFLTGVHRAEGGESFLQPSQGACLGLKIELSKTG